MTTKLAKHKLISALFAVTLLFLSSSITIPTYAKENEDSICDNSNITNEIKEASGCGNTGDKLPSAVINILNGIIAVSGLIAVVFVVIGGVQYMTSAGDGTKTKKAKDTILYACIGLIICALAFAIVNFVIVNIIG